MKKELVLGMIFLLIGNFFVSANSLENTVDNIGEKVSKVDGIFKTFFDSDKRNSFLEGKLESFFNNLVVKSILENFNKSLAFMNPFWKFALGIGYSFSGMFFVSFIFFIFLIKYGYSFSAILERFSEKLRGGKYLRLGSFSIFILIVCLLNIPMYFSRIMFLLFQEGYSSGTQFIISLIIFSILVILTIFSETISHFIKNLNFWKRVDKEIVKEVKDFKENSQTVEERLKRVEDDLNKRKIEKARKEEASKKFRGMFR